MQERHLTPEQRSRLTKIADLKERSESLWKKLLELELKAMTWDQMNEYNMENPSMLGWSIYIRVHGVLPH